MLTAPKRLALYRCGELDDFVPFWWARFLNRIPRILKLDLAARPAKPWLLFAGTVALVAVCLLGFYALLIDRTQRDALAEAEQRANGVVIAVADQLGRALTIVDDVLVDAAQQLAKENPASMMQSWQARIRHSSQLRALLLVDAEGQVAASTETGLRGLSLADRSWFQGLRLGTQTAQLGAPEPGQYPSARIRTGTPSQQIGAAGNWSIPYAIPLRNAEGTFQGALVGLLNADYLSAIARRNAEAFGLVLRLYNTHGLMVAGSLPGTMGIGEPPAITWPFRSPPLRRDSFVQIAVDTQGDQILMAFALSGPDGFVVEATSPMAAAMGRARYLGGALLAGISAIGAVTLAALWLLSRQIADLNQQSEALRMSEANARATAQAREDFLATMSHEIRTPMNGVVGMTELLLDTRLSPLQQHYAATIERSAEHLLMVLNDILDFSKLEAGMVEPECIPFNIEDEVATIAELFGPRATATGVELLCDLDPELPGSVLGDPARFRQILFNLVGNAVKFTERGWIEIAVSLLPAEGAQAHTHARLVCSVADTGIGIDPAKIPLMFERFTQADTSISRRYGGTGLGLTICRRLAEQMGGGVGAEPGETGGSVFFFDILVGLPEQPARRPARLEGRRVLLAEAHPAARRCMVQHVSAAGGCAEEAATVNDTLGLLRQAALQGQAFAAAVLGRLGPTGHEGLALARAIRTEQALAHTALILCSSSASIADQVAEDLPVHALMLRPVMPGRLRDTLERLLRPDVTGPSFGTDNGKGTAGRALHVLLVEDNATSQLVMRTMLEGAGCVVDIAPDGAGAVSRAQARRYDIILMDVQMPVMDGLEATRAIRTSRGPNRQGHIIGLTAALGPQFEAQCIEAGMDGYLPKPIQRATLLALLNSLRNRPVG